MPNNYTDLSPKDDTALQSRQMDHDASFRLAELEAGLFGKLFGSKNASANIAGLVIIALLVIGALVLFFPPKDTKPLEFWQEIIAVITLALGYLFGRRGQ